MMHKRTLIPLFLWLLYLIWFHISNYVIGDHPFHYVPAILSYLTMTATAAAWSIFIMPILYERKRYFLMFFAITLLYILYVIIGYLIEVILESNLYKIDVYQIGIMDAFLPGIKFFILFSIFGIAYYFAAFAGKKEAENLQLENDFLRAQIDPHFFLNSANHLIIDIRPIHPLAADNLAMLGEMMQYNMMKAGKDGKVPLCKEAQHIEHKIHFYNLRFPGTANIHFSHPPIPEQLRIPPLILITLVENALKHGEFNVADKPIDIDLTLNGNKLVFVVQNYKRTGKPDMTHGVGLPNLKKRLAMFYRNKFHFDIKEDERIFFVELVIPL